MDQRAADHLLDEGEVVPILQGNMEYIKDLVSKCLGEDIPASIGAEPCDAGGCSPRAMLLVRTGDAQQVANLMQREWIDLVAKEGTVQGLGAGVEVGEDEELPCPACGTAEPLDDDGACTDCGLVLG